MHSFADKLHKDADILFQQDSTLSHSTKTANQLLLYSIDLYIYRFEWNKT